MIKIDFENITDEFIYQLFEVEGHEAEALNDIYLELTQKTTKTYVDGQLAQKADLFVNPPTGFGRFAYSKANPCRRSFQRRCELLRRVSI